MGSSVGKYRISTGKGIRGSVLTTRYGARASSLPFRNLPFFATPKTTVGRGSAVTHECQRGNAGFYSTGSSIRNGTMTNGKSLRHRST